VYDVVYTMVVEDIRARALTDRGALLVAAAFGGSSSGPTDLPDPDAEAARFGELVAAPPEGIEPADVERFELLRALKLR
jgi:hypothetical protein